MPWFKVDDNLAFHHKAVAAGNAAMGLWVRAGAFCMQQLTDGFVPAHMVASLGNPAQARRLVDTHLWYEVEGGYRFHEWGERQPPKETIEAERAVARERMARKRRTKKGVFAKSSGEHPPNNSRSSPEVPAKFGKSSSTPTRPDPTSSSYGTTAAQAPPPHTAELTAAEPTAQTLIAEWIDHCNQPPPGRVTGQIAKEVSRMLDEGIDYERVRAGLAEWNTKDLSPSVLPSIVHGIANRTNGSRRQASTDDLFGRAMSRAQSKDAAR